MSRAFHVPAGSTIRFGAPARPLAQDVREKLTRGLSSISGISEAHLPLCQVVESMPEPVHLLVVVFGRQTAVEPAMPEVFELVRSVLPEGNHLDIWAFVQGDVLLETVHKADCCLFRSAPPVSR
jgi:hypothetical protein